VPLKAVYNHLVDATERISVFLTSLITSPVDREVKLEFTTNTPVQITMNGKAVMEEDYIDDTALGRFISGTHFTKITQMKAGTNTLVVDCSGAENFHARWFFGCAITSPDGDLLFELTYE
jgi:hypothetical protein